MPPLVRDIKNGIDLDIIEKMENDYLSCSGPCRECWAISLCHMCWVHLYPDPSRQSQKFKNERCEVTKEKYKYVLNSYIDIIEESPDSFENINKKINNFDKEKTK